MLKRENVQEQGTRNHALLNVITPVGLGFSKNSLELGENPVHHRIYWMEASG